MRSAEDFDVTMHHHPIEIKTARKEKAQITILHLKHHTNKFSKTLQAFAQKNKSGWKKEKKQQQKQQPKTKKAWFGVLSLCKKQSHFLLTLLLGTIPAMVRR
ncbi:hypothetical protein CEXT_218131 [Caerostris extrusa]|uniref:Uncharacterized protein n=1 Tax=Caerostris extrusa TaxID=172846 RepID=A0AAV4Y464_CAEEX|nr:hypothetical protein CEXT_218131 [Caerostris extrusa]